MSGSYKPSDSPYWHVDINVPGQKRRRESLQTCNLDHAMPIAREMAQEVLAARWGMTIARDVTFDEFLDVYEQNAKMRNAPRTLELNMWTLRRFREFAIKHLGIAGPLALGRISPGIVESFMFARKEQGISATTVNRDRGTLLTFMVSVHPPEIIEPAGATGAGLRAGGRGWSE